MKELVLTRIPPGDRWRDIKDGETMDSMTEAIEHIFQRAGSRQYILDCAKGEIYVEDGRPEPKEVKQFTMYGEEIRE